jgi:phage protein D
VEQKDEDAESRSSSKHRDAVDAEAERGARMAWSCRLQRSARLTHSIWKKKYTGVGLERHSNRVSYASRRRSSSGWWRISDWTGTCWREIVRKKL